MENEKRLIDANEFWNRLSHVVYDFFTIHEKDGRLTNAASVGYCKETIQEVLKQTKTVDAVEVVHGRWETVSSMLGYLCCSECKDVYIWDTWLEDGKWNYCPNCGAKMDGDGNG